MKQLQLKNGDILAYSDENKDIVITEIINFFASHQAIIEGEDCSEGAEDDYICGGSELLIEVFNLLKVNFIQKEDEDEV